MQAMLGTARAAADDLRQLAQARVPPPACAGAAGDAG